MLDLNLEKQALQRNEKKPDDNERIQEHESDGAQVLYERHLREELDKDDEDSDSDEETTEGKKEPAAPPPRPKRPSFSPTAPPQPLMEYAWPTKDQTTAEETAALTEPIEAELVEAPAPVRTPDAPEYPASGGELDADDFHQPPHTTAPAPQPHAATPNTPPPAPQQPPTGPYGYNTPPQGAAGQQPPMPPVNTPPTHPGFGYPGGPHSPNTPPPYVPNPNSPNYAPAPQPQYNQAPNYNVAPPYNGRVKGVDTLARLGVVGNFIGNRRTRKRLGKQIEENQHETNTNFADIQSQQLRFKQTQEQQARDLRQLRNERDEAIAQQQAYGPGQSAERPYAAPVVAPQAEATPNALPPIHQPNAAPQSGPAHNPQQIPGLGYPGEQQRTAVPLFAEQQPQQPGSMAEQSSQQPSELQSRQHLEPSPQYNVVVNERGQEVSGAMQYGDAFQRERRHEILSDQTAAASSTSGYAASQAQGGFGVPGQQYPGSLPSGMTTPGLPQGAPTHADAQHQLPARTHRSTMPGVAFWIMLTLIVAAFFAAALI